MSPHIGQGNSVEFREEILRGPEQHALECAVMNDEALVVGAVKALHHGEVGCGVTHHSTQGNLTGRFYQPHATAASAGGFNPASSGQIVDDLGQVAARNAMAFGNFGNRARLRALLMLGTVHQHAQGIVSPLGQSHVKTTSPLGAGREQIL